MTTVPSNLIPTRITELPEYQDVSTLGFLPYVIDGVTYKVQFSNIAAVGAVPSTRTITGGGGLAGGGDLSADRVISIAAGGVGFGQLADSGVAAGVYGDATNIPVLTVDTKGRVTVATTTPIDLTAYVTTSRAITAGAGLTGGGTLAADRTISLTLSAALPESGGTPSAGTATVAAREDHVHPAVDLSDATETSGALPMSRGGTGSSLSPAAGAILYSNGSNVDLSGAGTAEQLFFSQGSAAPIFRSLTGGTTGLAFGLSGSAYVLSGTLATASGGTGAVTAAAARVNLLPSYTGNANYVLALNGSATDVVWVPVTGGGGSGTVTSVSGTGTVSGLTLTGTVTTSGSLTLGGTLTVVPSDFASQTANTFLAAPNGAPGAPTFRAIVGADIPTLNQNTTGTAAAVAGGAANQILFQTGAGATSFITAPTVSSTFLSWNGSAFVWSAAGGGGSGTVTSVDLTAGTGISVSGGPITTSGSITVTNTAPDQTVVLTAGTNVSITGTYPAFTINSTDQFVGTVTSVSVVSANGLAGTVATNTTTPAITLSTSVTGVVKGNGTALSAAAAGTDYVAPGAITTSGLTMATARLLGRTTASTGAAEEITVGSGLTLSAGTLSAAGGGLTHWTEGVDTAAPNATVPVVYFAATNAATDVDAAILTKGTGALLAAIPDNTTAGGNKRGIYAVDWQRQRGLATEVASGVASVVGGGMANTASGDYSVVAGGGGDDGSLVYGNIASGDYSFVGGGFLNTATAGRAFVGGGDSNVASGFLSFVGGGELNIASGFYSFVGGGNDNTASGQQSSIAGGNTNIASGTGSFVGGGYLNTASGVDGFATVGGGEENTASNGWATVGGGYNNTASGVDGFATVGGGEENTASNGWATVGGGSNNTASGDSSTVAGGLSNIASGAKSALLGGQDNTASGANSTVGGGYGNTASGAISCISGGRMANTRGLYGAEAFAAGSFSNALGEGDAQRGLYIARGATTNATPLVITFNQDVAGTTNQVVLPNNATYFFKVSIVARRIDANNESAAYTFEGCIDRNADAASTALVGTPVKTILAEDTSAWDVSVSADTINGALAITVTGQAAKTIRWVAKIETVEVVG